MLLGKCTKSNFPEIQVGKTYAFRSFCFLIEVYEVTDGNIAYESVFSIRVPATGSIHAKLEFGLSMIFLSDSALLSKAEFDVC